MNLARIVCNLLKSLPLLSFSVYITVTHLSTGMPRSFSKGSHAAIHRSFTDICNAKSNCKWAHNRLHTIRDGHQLLKKCLAVRLGLRLSRGLGQPFYRMQLPEGNMLYFVSSAADFEIWSFDTDGAVVASLWFTCCTSSSSQRPQMVCLMGLWRDTSTGCTLLV